MEGFDNEVCRRLPLAEAALRMLDYVCQYVCQEGFLEAVFAKHHGPSYEDLITFTMLVRLVSDALLQYEGSGRQAIERARETGELESCRGAPYGKLARVPLYLSLGLLAEAVMRPNELYPNVLADRAAHKSLRKMEIIYHDGKTIKHVAKRMPTNESAAGIALLPIVRRSNRKSPVWPREQNVHLSASLFHGVLLRGPVLQVLRNHLVDRSAQSYTDPCLLPPVPCHSCSPIPSSSSVRAVANRSSQSSSWSTSAVDSTALTSSEGTSPNRRRSRRTSRKPPQGSTGGFRLLNLASAHHAILWNGHS